VRSSQLVAARVDARTILVGGGYLQSMGKTERRQSDERNEVRLLEEEAYIEATSGGLIVVTVKLASS
jgi:hypothetical protein